MSVTDYSYGYNGRVLKLENIGVSFGSHVVLRNVNIEVQNITRPNMQQGQVVALLGPSGIGKTQLFRLMAGLSIPDGQVTGRVLLGNEDTPARVGLVGVVAQHYPLFEHRTVLGNLKIARAQSGGTEQEINGSVQELLQQFDLEQHAEAYPAQLSGGQRQRVAIAQQMLCSKYFILMDEPFSGLDPVMTDRVIGLIQRITCLDEYNTTILVSHNIDAALAVADTVWVLGRDRDAAGQVVPGAYIKKTYDLAAMGLAWRPNIREDPKFAALNLELRKLFPTL